MFRVIQNPLSANLVVASNRLPISATLEKKRWKFSTSPGGLVSALSSSHVKMDWIGWSGIEVTSEQRAEVTEAFKSRCEKFDLHPVFLDQEQKDNYYNGFSNRVIWPNFHDLPHLMRFSPAYWSAYRQVNQRFAAEILLRVRQHQEKEPEKDVLVWIHDYQLMLVPGMLRELVNAERRAADLKLKIGFFLHIPFPSVRGFHFFPRYMRRDLLNGLLASDVIGFHDRVYRDSFASNVQADFKIAPSLSMDEIVCSDNHVAHLGVYPIGIDPKKFERALKQDETQQKVSHLRRYYGDVRVILGVDRLDPAKGLVEKLHGYAHFLENNPAYHGKIVLAQILVPSRFEIQEYVELKDHLFRFAESINNRFTPPGGCPPVELLYKNFDLQSLSAFYRVADALLVTSLKDGMNLVSFEYSACQAMREGGDRQEHNQGNKKTGVVILSDRAGAAKRLAGSVLIDPSNEEAISRAILSAITMDEAEKERRIDMNAFYVKHETSQVWVNHFVRDLSEAREEKEADQRTRYSNGLGNGAERVGLLA